MNRNPDDARLGTTTQGLGLEYCRTLVKQGCRTILVASRSGCIPLEMLVEFAQAGCTVLAVTLDSSCAASLSVVLEWAHCELPFVEHFAHAAGVPGFAMLGDITPGQFHAVTDVKVRIVGLVYYRCSNGIHALVLLEPLATQLAGFVPLPVLQTGTAAAFQQAALPLLSRLLFSSTSAVWSQSGSAHYAAGNAALDADAAAGHSVGLPATAVQYGPFAGAGMAAAYVEGLEALGLKSLLPQQVCVFPCVM